MADEGVSIKGLDKADVLAALYNASSPQGAGFIEYDPTPMGKAEAQMIIDQQGLRFDYLKGRVMKINLSGDIVDHWSFDSDNGQQGAVEKVIKELRSTKQVNTSAISEIHEKGTETALDLTKSILRDETVTTIVEVDGNRSRPAKSIVTVSLGLSELAPALTPKLRQAEQSLTKTKQRRN